MSYRPVVASLCAALLFAPLVSFAAPGAGGSEGGAPVKFRGGQWLCVTPEPDSQVRVIVGTVWLNGSGPSAATYELEGIPDCEMYVALCLPACFDVPLHNSVLRQTFADRFNAMRVTITDDTGAEVFDSTSGCVVDGKEVARAWSMSGTPAQWHVWSGPSAMLKFRNDRKYTMRVDASMLRSPPFPGHLEVRLERPLLH